MYRIAIRSSLLILLIIALGSTASPDGSQPTTTLCGCISTNEEGTNDCPKTYCEGDTESCEGGRGTRHVKCEKEEEDEEEDEEEEEGEGENEKIKCEWSDCVCSVTTERQSCGYCGTKSRGLYADCSHSAWSVCIEDLNAPTCTLDCLPQTQSSCTTASNCPGIHVCKPDGTWAVCIDVANDTCPQPTQCVTDESKACTISNCPGTQICKTDGMWGECSDIANDDCPQTAQCQSGQSKACTTESNCPGIQGCSSGNWGSCLDAPNDDCPAVCTDGKSCRTTDNCPGEWSCNKNACVDFPGDGCPYINTTPYYDCDPGRQLSCELSGCPGVRQCDGTGQWQPCRDKSDDNCPIDIPPIAYCVPLTSANCITSQSCPGIKKCSATGSYGPCEDVADDQCPKPLEIRFTNKKTNSCPAPLSNLLEWGGPIGSKYSLFYCIGKDCEATTFLTETTQTGFIHKNLREKSDYTYRLVGSGFEDRVTLTTNECVRACLPGETKRSDCGQVRLQGLRCLADGSGWIAVTKCESEQLDRATPETWDAEAMKIISNIRNESALKADVVSQQVAENVFENNTELINEAQHEAIGLEVKTKVLDLLIRSEQKAPSSILEEPLDQEGSTIRVQKPSATRLNSIKNKAVARESAQRIRDSIKEESLATLESKIDEQIQLLDTNQELEEFDKRVSRAQDIVVQKMIRHENGRTIVTLLIEPEALVENLTIYEEIPKNIANSAEKISFFSENVQIVDNDPVIAWEFATAPETISVSYAVEGVLEGQQMEDTATVLTAASVVKEPKSSFTLLQILFPIVMTVGILITVLLVGREHQFMRD